MAMFMLLVNETASWAPLNEGFPISEMATGAKNGLRVKRRGCVGLIHTKDSNGCKVIHRTVCQ